MNCHPCQVCACLTVQTELVHEHDQNYSTSVTCIHSDHNTVSVSKGMILTSHKFEKIRQVISESFQLHAMRIAMTKLLQEPELKLEWVLI